MTAQDWTRKRALRKFALAVMGLGISLRSRAKLLDDGIEHEKWWCDEFVKPYVTKFGCNPWDDYCSDDRTRIRRAYRNLLRACGVDSRHV